MDEAIQQLAIGISTIILVLSMLWLLVGVLAYNKVQSKAEAQSFLLFARRVLKQMRWPTLLFGLSNGILLGMIWFGAQGQSTSLLLTLLVFVAFPLSCILVVAIALLLPLCLHFFLESHPGYEEDDEQEKRERI